MFNDEISVLYHHKTKYIELPFSAKDLAWDADKKYGFRNPKEFSSNIIRKYIAKPFGMLILYFRIHAKLMPCVIPRNCTA